MTILGAMSLSGMVATMTIEEPDAIEMAATLYFTIEWAYWRGLKSIGTLHGCTTSVFWSLHGNITSRTSSSSSTSSVCICCSGMMSRL